MEQYKQWATQRQCEIIDAVIANGTQAAAADALGVTKRSVERALARVRAKAAKHGYSPEHNMTHTSPNTHIVKGASTLYGDDGEVKLQWVKTDLKKEMLIDAYEEAAKEICQDVPRFKPTKTKLKDTQEALAAYVIGDAHIGMIVQDHHNSGQGSWNLDIAEKVTLEAISRLIDLSGNTDVAMLVDVGDFQHADRSDNVSQSGHFHKTDGDFKDVILTCVRIYRQAITMMLEKHKEVVVVLVRGNHNKDSSLFIGSLLEAVYENEPRVTVLDNRHKTLQFTYHNCFFGFHHGDRMKIDQMYQYLTSVYAEDWGKTTHRHCMLGHIHHHQSKEYGSCIFESFNSMATQDEWHAHSMYNSKRTMTSIIFDKEHGEVQRHKIGIAQLRAA